MVRVHSLVLAAFGLFFLTVSAANAQDPAREPKPIFADATDARPAFDAACRRAVRDNRRVLVFFGGDWSVWCQRFHELTRRDRDVGSLLRNDYVMVLAAVMPESLPEANAELATRLGANPVEDGVPLLVVVSPDGEVIARQTTNAFEQAENYDPAPVVEFLKQNAARPLDAREVLAAARAQAAQDGRKLFIHLGAPWCGWCGRLEDFLALPEIDARIAKDLIDVKIDQDRMTNGAVVAGELRGDRRGGIPWIVITDADLNELITSDGPEGNTGYPVAPAEILHFMAMLERVRENMTEEDLGVIRSVLEARAREILDSRQRAAEAPAQQEPAPPPQPPGNPQER